MKSIWFVVGLLLTILGAMITLSGAYSWTHPPGQAKVLSTLHPDFWWGLVILVFGAIFVLAHRGSPKS